MRNNDWRSELTKIGREVRLHAAARLRGARLAPGNILADVDFGQDRWALKELCEKHGQVFRLRFREHELFCMAQLDMGARFLKANSKRLAAQAPDVSDLVADGFMRKMEGAVHQKYRRIFLKAFTDLPAHALEAEIRSDARRLIAALAGEPAGHTKVAAAAKKFATFVLLRLVLGVRSDEDLEALEALYQRMSTDGLRSKVARSPEAIEAFTSIRRFLDAYASDERSLYAQIRKDGQADETVIGNLILMVEFGRYDFHGLVRWLLVELSGDTDLQDEIAAEKDPDLRHEKCLWAVKEALRLNQSEYLHRVAREAIVFEGYYIPKDTLIRVCVREAHRGPGFTKADSFCPHRFRDNRYSQSQYAPLGMDRHSCLGANWVFDIAAMLAGEIAESSMLTREGNGHSTERETFHFEPGSGSRLRLVAR